MTKEERKEFYNCSIQDFVKRFNSQNFTNLNDALKDSMKYIARYNLDPRSTKCDINELLYVAKNELVKLAVKNQIEIKGDDLMVKSFIADPIRATSYYLERNDSIFDEIQDGPQSDMMYISFLRRNASALANNIKNPPYPSNYRKFEEKQSQSLELIATLELQLSDSDNPIENEFKKQKPNIFEKILRKTSKEYKAFEKVFNKHYKNPDSPLFGDNDYLKAHAIKYLHHKFPDLENDELPTEEQINALGGKGKARAGFCLKVVKAINEKNAIEDKMHDIKTNLKFTIDKFPWEKDNVKTLLEEQLEKDEQMENAPLAEESKKNLVKNTEVEEYDSKYDQLDMHDAQDIFK